MKAGLVLGPRSSLTPKTDEITAPVVPTGSVSASVKPAAAPGVTKTPVKVDASVAGLAFGPVKPAAAPVVMVDECYYASPKSLPLGPPSLFKDELESRLKAGLASKPRSPAATPVEPKSTTEPDLDSGVELGPRGTLKKAEALNFANLDDIEGEPNLRTSV